MFGLGDLGLHLFLVLKKAQLKNVVHLQKKLIFGLLFLLAEQLGYLLLVVVALLVLILMLELYRS